MTPQRLRILVVLGLLLGEGAARMGGATDEGRIRAQAVRGNVPIITTIAGARAAVQAIQALRGGNWQVTAIQDYFPHLARPAASSAPAQDRKSTRLNSSHSSVSRMPSSA